MSKAQLTAVDPKDALTARPQEMTGVEMDMVLQGTRLLREFSSENLEGSSGSRQIRDKSGLWLKSGLAFM